MTHEERIRLIMRPFPRVRVIGGAGSALPWAGTIVADNFYGRPDLFMGDKDKARTVARAMDEFALPRYGWTR